MTDRPVLVGMNNPLSVAPKFALYLAPAGCAGHRLWQMLAEETGASSLAYVDRFERVNLCVGAWCASSARLAAQEMHSAFCARGAHVVLLGEEARKAFGLPTAEVGEPLTSDGVVYYILPHPSGRNRRMNDPEVRRRVGRVFGEAV